MKKILILGTGAMGTLMAAKLSAAGADVTLLGRNENQRQLVESEGLFLLEGDRTCRVSAGFVTKDEELTGPYDLIVVTVKAYDTTAAMERCVGVIGPDTVVLTLQNGWGNDLILQRFVSPDRIVCGTTSCGAFREGLNRVRFGGQGETYIGQKEKGREDRFQPLLTLFETAGFAPTPVDNAEKTVFNKVLVNVGINALTAILGVRNGKLIENEHTDRILAAAVAEGVTVGRALSLVDEGTDHVEACRAVCRFTKENRSSMLQDVSAGRRTEVDFINGAVVRRGRELGIPTPVNETLYNLVKALEKNFREE